MAKQLNIDEMLDVVHTLEHPCASAWQRVIEHVGTEMAEAIANDLGVECGVASFEGTAFAGTCAPFWPSYEGQEEPEELSFYDQGEWGDVPPQGEDDD